MNGLTEGSFERTSMKIAYGWLILAVFSLVFAGIFALLVALARTPVIEQMLPLGRDYIYVALVGHVVLAVVIWFLAFEGFLWVFTTTILIKKKVFSPALGWVSLCFSGAGMALVVISAVFGLGNAELANYVPVLLTPVFYAGLILFAAGIILNLVNSFATLLSGKREGSLPVITFAMAASGIAVAVALACFALSGWFQYSTGKMFLDFERLFWGGGHILQFANTMAMIAVWLYLSRLAFRKEPLPPMMSKALYGLFLIFIIPSPVIYFLHDTSTQAYKESFTWLMQWGIGPSTTVFMLAAAGTIVRGRRPWADPGFSSLVLSISIFLMGGLIGVGIGGGNTIIPAHYHCVIGAVTIAFMGLFYEILPAFGKTVWSRKLAVVQPYLYSLGIVLFAAGLFYAGSHGVARKTYGSEQNLNTTAKFIAMSIMGIGGLVAISGGIAFVLNAMLSLFGNAGKVAGVDAAAVIENR